MVNTSIWVNLTALQYLMSLPRRFGEESAEEMVEWVIDHFGVSTDPSATSPTILDVGCGNAHLLMLLAEAVWPSQYTIEVSLFGPAGLPDKLAYGHRLL